MTATLTDDGLGFVTEYHLASLTTLRADGRPHVTPVGFTYDPDLHEAFVICDGGSQKAVNVRRAGAVALCQVDRGRWLTIEGTAVVSDDPTAVADAVARYTVRYRPPRVNPNRVVVRITPTAILGSPSLVDRS